MDCPHLSPSNDLPCVFYEKPADPDEIGFCNKTSGFLCTEAMKKKLPNLSYSQLTDWASCKMRWYYHKVMGLEIIPQAMPEPMKLGAAWDQIIQHLYCDRSIDLDPLFLTGPQLAKLRALFRAFKDLEIAIPKNPSCQHRIDLIIGQNIITGYVDVALYEGIEEHKLSSRPEFYHKLENVMQQAGTYLLDCGSWEYVVVKAVRVPQLKTGSGKMSEESDESFEERCHADIISRPTYYFPGWNRKTREYGVKFWRSELRLDEVHRTYRYMIRELRDTLEHRSWYKNRLQCYVPAPCMYLPICKSGIDAVSENIFTKKGETK